MLYYMMLKPTYYYLELKVQKVLKLQMLIHWYYFHLHKHPMDYMMTSGLYLFHCFIFYIYICEKSLSD